MKAKRKQYGVWDKDEEYFYLYDSIEKAVKSYDGRLVEIFEMTARPIGKYKLKAEGVSPVKKTRKQR